MKNPFRRGDRRRFREPGDDDEAPDQSGPPAAHQPPGGWDVPAIPGRVVIAFRQLVRGVMEIAQVVLHLHPAPGSRLQVQCETCGAEFAGQWRHDGSPIYTGGVLRLVEPRRAWNATPAGEYRGAVFRAEACRLHAAYRLRPVRRCRCMVGHRFPELAEADDRTWAAANRRNRWAARAGRRMTEAAGRERMMDTWPTHRQTDYALRVAEYRAAGMDHEAAEARAYVEMGDAGDAPIQRPWKRTRAQTQEADPCLAL